MRGRKCAGIKPPRAPTRAPLIMKTRTSRLTCNLPVLDRIRVTDVRTSPEWRGKIPWIKLYLADAGVSPDWSLQPAEQLMFLASARR